MREGEQVIGALSRLGRSGCALGTPDLATARAVADVATMSILRRRATEAALVLADQLQHALDSRVTIEQAKGVLSKYAGLDADAAFAALRRFARDRSLQLGDVARDRGAHARCRRDLAPRPVGPRGRVPTHGAAGVAREDPVPP